MKTFREIAEMHYASEPSNEFDKQYRENRINALEKLLTEQLRKHDVVGRSEQLLPKECSGCGMFYTVNLPKSCNQCGHILWQ
jgi:hypothetical protein